jgi:membrane protein DedA with SNARE-associated domain
LIKASAFSILTSMDSFAASFMPYIDKYGYWAVAGAILPEGFGIPAPGETALVAAALLAARGDMSLSAVLATAFWAAVAGNTVGYGLGCFGGRPLILRYGRYLFITTERLQRVEAFFARYGRAIILAARFVDVFRQLNGIVAGTTRMPFLRFQFYNVLGASVWVGFWGSLAYLLGQDASHLHQTSMRLRYGFCAALAILFAGVILSLLWKHRAKDR